MRRTPGLAMVLLACLDPNLEAKRIAISHVHHAATMGAENCEPWLRWAVWLGAAITEDRIMRIGR